MDTPKPRLTIDITNQIALPVFSPDGERLITVSDGRLRVFDLKDGNNTQSFSIQTRTGQNMAYHPHLAQVAIVGVAGVQILDITNGKTVRNIPLPRPPNHVSWHPDGELLAASTEHQVYICDAIAGRQIRQMEHPGGGIHVAFHPRGELLASSGWSGGLRFWNTYTGTLALAIERTSAFPEFGPNNFVGQLFSQPGKKFTGRISQIETRRLIEALPLDRAAKTILTISGLFASSGWPLAGGRDTPRIQLDRLGHRSRKRFFSCKYQLGVV